MSKPLLIIRFNIKAEKEKEFNEWYNAYIPRFMKQVPEIVSAKRVVSINGGQKEYMSIYEIESEEKIEVALKKISGDDPNRKKDSAEWHEWEECCLSNIYDGVYKTIYTQ